MKINLLYRISAVVHHFKNIKGLGNSKPLMEVLEKNPDLRMLVTTRQQFDKKYWDQMVTVTDLAVRKPAENRFPTIVDHYVLSELLVGSQKLFETLCREILRLNEGIISSERYSPNYSPIFELAKVRVNGRYIDNCVYVNLNTKVVRAYRTNANGKIVVVDGVSEIVTIQGETVNVHFTLP